MPLASTPLVLPKAHTTIPAANGTVLRFYHGDCVEVMQALEPATVSAIVTSPPYNLGVSYRSYDDSMPRASYLEWTDAWIAAAARTLAPKGSLFLNVGAKPTDPWTAMEVAQTARRHLQLQNTIHWIKSIAIDQEVAGAGARLDRDLAVGHYKPINSDRFVNDCHEFIFQFTPEGRTPLDRRAIGVPYQDESNIARWAAGKENKRCRGNAWFIPYETIQSRDKERPHPATFPPRLADYCLRLHGLSRLGFVMDPFLGLGSTAVACAERGLNFIGIELDEHYLGEAIERVRRHGGLNPATDNTDSTDTFGPRPTRRARTLPATENTETLLPLVVIRRPVRQNRPQDQIVSALNEMEGRLQDASQEMERPAWADDRCRAPRLEECRQSCELAGRASHPRPSFMISSASRGRAFLEFISTTIT